MWTVYRLNCSIHLKTLTVKKRWKESGKYANNFLLLHCKKSEMSSNSMFFHLSTFKWIEIVFIYICGIHFFFLFPSSVLIQLVNFNVVFSIHVNCAIKCHLCVKRMFYIKCLRFSWLNFGWNIQNGRFKMVFSIERIIIYRIFESQKVWLIGFSNTKYEQNDNNKIKLSRTIHHHISKFLYFGCYELWTTNTLPFTSEQQKKTHKHTHPKNTSLFFRIFTGIENKTLYTWVCLVI